MVLRADCHYMYTKGGCKKTHYQVLQVMSAFEQPLFFRSFLETLLEKERVIDCMKAIYFLNYINSLLI